MEEICAYLLAQNVTTAKSSYLTQISVLAKLPTRILVPLLLVFQRCPFRVLMGQSWKSCCINEASSFPLVKLLMRWRCILPQSIWMTALLMALKLHAHQIRHHFALVPVYLQSCSMIWVFVWRPTHDTHPGETHGHRDLVSWCFWIGSHQGIHLTPSTLNIIMSLTLPSYLRLLKQLNLRMCPVPVSTLNLPDPSTNLKRKRPP